LSPNNWGCSREESGQVVRLKTLICRVPRSRMLGAVLPFFHLSSWHAASAKGKHYFHFPFTNKNLSPNRKGLEADRTCILLQTQSATNLMTTRLMTDGPRPLSDSNQTDQRPNTLHGSLLLLLLVSLLLWYNRYRINGSTTSNNDTLASLNLPKLQSRRWHLNVLFLVNVFSNKTCCTSIPNKVSSCKLTRFISHHSVVYLILYIVRRSALQAVMFLPLMLSLGISIISITAVLR